MDQKKSYFIDNPAQLFIGTEVDTTQYTYGFLQKQLCINSCSSCHICKQITEHQHPAITWLSVDRWYTKETLVPLFQQIRFILEANQMHFFIVQKADKLLAHAANSLLKSLEEPPTGYCFILLAQHKNLVLPTIQSRCAITVIRNQQKQLVYDHPLVKSLLAIKPPASSVFLGLLDTTNPNESETTELLQQLVCYWQQKLKRALQSRHTISFIQAKVNHLEALLRSPIPMGSAKLVWRHILIVWPRQRSL